MPYRIRLALSLGFASTSASPAMSECQADGEKAYQYCVDKRSKSEAACRVDHEKCRKACAKRGRQAVARVS